MVRESSKGLFRAQSTYTGRSGRKGIQGLLNLNRPKREKENNRTYIATKGEKEVQRSKETLPMKEKGKKMKFKVEKIKQDTNLNCVSYLV